MKPEYKELLGQLERDLAAAGKYECMLVAVRRCEALASKPQVRLSEKELYRVWESFFGGGMVMDRLCAIQEHILAAQPNAPEPDPFAVPLDYNEWAKGGWQAYLREGQFYYPHDELVIGKTYVMRRK